LVDVAGIVSFIARCCDVINLLRRFQELLHETGIPIFDDSHEITPVISREEYTDNSPF